ncbi:MAG: tRNA pseudouridine(55) synthase TruB [Puniceicoccales bacterium]|jgi:tRNA pseudouridine55 synthase|nr:tRNA pseudouridine(55) synthase TruB [Puniceicoccales bacterium]
MGGILLVDKPLGLSSAGAVGRLRRRLPDVRVGHGGTLDPLATGLLVLLLGSATKLSGAVAGGDKTYGTTVRFGFSTAGDDGEGRPTGYGHFPWLAEGQVEGALRSFLGKRLQRPPAFCAKKIRGVAAYRLARRGMAAPGEPEPITVHAIENVRWSAPLLSFTVRCSKGTYVRSLARDLGEALACPAHLHALRRTHSGPFSLSSARPLAEWESLPLEELLAAAEETEAQFLPTLKN